MGDTLRNLLLMSPVSIAPNLTASRIGEHRVVRLLPTCAGRRSAGLRFFSFQAVSFQRVIRLPALASFAQPRAGESPGESPAPPKGATHFRRLSMWSAPRSRHVPRAALAGSTDGTGLLAHNSSQARNLRSRIGLTEGPACA